MDLAIPRKKSSGDPVSFHVAPSPDCNDGTTFTYSKVNCIRTLGARKNRQLPTNSLVKYIYINNKRIVIKGRWKTESKAEGW